MRERRNARRSLCNIHFTRRTITGDDTHDNAYRQRNTNERACGHCHVVDGLALILLACNRSLARPSPDNNSEIREYKYCAQTEASILCFKVVHNHALCVLYCQKDVDCAPISYLYTLHCFSLLASRVTVHYNQIYMHVKCVFLLLFFFFFFFFLIIHAVRSTYHASEVVLIVFREMCTAETERWPNKRYDHDVSGSHFAQPRIIIRYVIKQYTEKNKLKHTESCVLCLMVTITHWVLFATAVAAANSALIAARWSFVHRASDYYFYFLPTATANLETLKMTKWNSSEQKPSEIKKNRKKERKTTHEDI